MKNPLVSNNNKMASCNYHFVPFRSLFFHPSVYFRFIPRQYCYEQGHKLIKVGEAKQLLRKYMPFFLWNVYTIYLWVLESDKWIFWYSLFTHYTGRNSYLVYQPIIKVNFYILYLQLILMFKHSRLTVSFCLISTPTFI